MSYTTYPVVSRSFQRKSDRRRPDFDENPTFLSFSVLLSGTFSFQVYDTPFNYSCSGFFHIFINTLAYLVWVFLSNWFVRCFSVFAMKWRWNSCILMIFMHFDEFSLWRQDDGWPPLRSFNYDVWQMDSRVLQLMKCHQSFAHDSWEAQSVILVIHAFSSCNQFWREKYFISARDNWNNSTTAL